MIHCVSPARVIRHTESVSRSFERISNWPFLYIGSLYASIADIHKAEALPLIRRFYDLGFNIEATAGTAAYLRDHGIRTRARLKLSDGSTEIIDSLRQGHVNYVINVIDIDQHNTRLDGYEIRRAAVENNVTIFTALETVKVLLDVLEEITFNVSTIDAE